MRLVNQLAARQALANAGFSDENLWRYFWLFDGVEDRVELLDQQLNPVAVEVDQVKLFVFPISGGNAGLPTGAPALTNGVWHELDYAHSGTIQEIGKNGAAYFHGYIANPDLLFGGVSVALERFNADLSSSQLSNRVPEPEA